MVQWPRKPALQPSSTSSPAAYASSVTFSQKPARDPESGRGDETRHLASLGRAKHPMLNVSLLTSSCSYQTAIIRNDKQKTKSTLIIFRQIELYFPIFSWDFRYRLPPQAKFTDSICKVAKTKSSFLANFCVCIFPCNSYGFHAPITKYLTNIFRRFSNRFLLQIVENYTGCPNKFRIANRKIR